MDVLGLRVVEARRRLTEAGVEVREKLTAPPRGGVEGVGRVVRVRRDESGVALSVAMFPELRLND